MKDPVITSREVADLLGVSIRTAQGWIEQNIDSSWKTPGGHRRVRRSAVVESMARVGSKIAEQTSCVLVHAVPHRLRHYRDILELIPECVTFAEEDIYSMLLTAGRLMPAVIVLENNSEIDLPLPTMMRHILECSHLGHTKILVVGDFGGTDLDLLSTFGERLHVIGSTASEADLRDRVRHMFADAIMFPGVPTSSEQVQPIHETNRLRAVSASGLLDTPSEESFDEITRLAASALGTPIALVTLITEDRQFFKSHWGTDQKETPRSWAFCNETIMQHDVFVVDDATNDVRFANNPFVVAGPKIRFYAGVPIRDVAGFALGALCVIDRAPRRLTQTQRNTLLTLGRLTSDRVNVRIRERQLRWAKMDRS